MLIFNKTKAVKSPTRSHIDAGLDFYIPDGQRPLLLEPGDSCNIASGIRLVLPDHLVGVFYNKSSIGVRGLLVGACVIDASYRGEVHINLWNVSKKDLILTPGQKIVQMVITPIVTTPFKEISQAEYNTHESTRGTGAFGSTGE